MVSDGIAFNPYRTKGFDFIPQQLWDVKNVTLEYGQYAFIPKRWMKRPSMNFMKASQRAILNNIIEVEDVPYSKSDKKFTDKIYATAFLNMYKFKQQINQTSTFAEQMRLSFLIEDLMIKLMIVGGFPPPGSKNLGGVVNLAIY